MKDTPRYIRLHDIDVSAPKFPAPPANNVTSAKNPPLSDRLPSVWKTMPCASVILYPPIASTQSGTDFTPPANDEDNWTMHPYLIAFNHPRIPLG